MMELDEVEVNVMKSIILRISDLIADENHFNICNVAIIQHFIHESVISNQLLDLMRYKVFVRIDVRAQMYSIDRDRRLSKRFFVDPITLRI